MNKEGLAPVISIALITLGVVVAVTILWAFASKTIDTKNRVVNPECFTVDLSVVSCRTHGLCSYAEGFGVYESDILVKRKIGKADLTGLRFSFEDSLGRKKIYDSSFSSLILDYSLEELQSLRFNVPFNKIPSSGPTDVVRVTPLIGKNYEVCPSFSQPLRCSSGWANFPPIGSIPGLTNTEGQCCQSPRNESECYDGNDVNYPIIEGIVHNTSDPSNSNIIPSVYPYGTPPGNLSVCCAFVPE